VNCAHLHNFLKYFPYKGSFSHIFLLAILTFNVARFILKLTHVFKDESLLWQSAGVKGSGAGCVCLVVVRSLIFSFCKSPVRLKTLSPILIQGGVLVT